MKIRITEQEGNTTPLFIFICKSNIMTKIIKELVFGVPRTGEKIFAKDKIEIKSTYPKKWTGSDSEYFVWCREYRVGILTDKTKFIFS